MMNVLRELSSQSSHERTTIGDKKKSKKSRKSVAL